MARRMASVVSAGGKNQPRSPDVKHRARPSRLQMLIREASKFGVVGGVAYVIDFVVSNVCHDQFHMESLVAKTISTVVAAVFAYVGNRKWSFSHRAADNVRREFTVFFGLNAVGLGITLGCLGFAEHVLHLKGTVAFNLFGNILGTGLATVFRFWAYKRFVFVQSADPLAAGGQNPARASRMPEPAGR
jgi:putative flippase GtrA